MADKNNTSDLKKDTAALIQRMKEFALTVGEDCPEGHRRDPGSGACLPMGPLDHTAFTRSLNDDQGDAWRGLKDKAEENKESALLDAFDMDEPVSCGEGTSFSFVQRRCVSSEEAEAENNDAFAMTNENTYVEEEADHKDVVALDPEGRRDPVGFKCPPKQFFDFKLRECIPLNKDTVLASEDVDAGFKEAVASYLNGRLAVTSPDPLDGHTHLVTVDTEGNGKSSVSSTYVGSETYFHSHDVKVYEVKDFSEGEYTSKHFGHVIPKDMWEWRDEECHDSMPAPAPSVVCCSEDSKETAAPITTKQRKGLSDSAFGVPGKRKFPLDTCGRVRNAMARFNQSKGLTSGEKATLRRKILAAAKKCGVEVKNFAKADNAEEFLGVLNELLLQERVVKQYSANEEKVQEETPTVSRGATCPPGMEWDMKSKKCAKMKGFYDIIKAQGSHSEVIALDPEGRKDTPGFQCPPGFFFNFATRKCLALDPSRKEGTSTSKAAEDAAQRDLAPSPKGRPARLPQDCPSGTIWDADLEDCKPLDSRKKTKSAEEDAQSPANGPGKGKDSKGCAPGEFLNPVTKKCMPRKGAFKGKSDSENSGDEGLIPAPEGRVKNPVDCPAGTLWDGVNKLCRPLDSGDKSRPGEPGPQDAKDTAAVDKMSVSNLIKHLDEMIRNEDAAANKEKSKVAAKSLPNEAFPPSLVNSTRRNLMHHTLDVVDAYDNASVDVSRLRNALARVEKVEGYSPRAVEDAREHLLYHAREVVKAYLGKS